MSDPLPATDQRSERHSGDDLQAHRIHADVRASRPIVERRFGGFLELRDPTDMLGTYLPPFAINANISLSPTGHLDTNALRRDIYYAVDNGIRYDLVGDVKFEMVDYNDAKVLREPPRRYIVARLTTPRDTTITTQFRCYVAGQNLYVAADSFMLGRIRWLYVAAQALLSAFVFFASIFNPFAWIPATLYFWWAWADVVRAVRFGNMSIGLRARYPKPLRDSSFDLDDTFQFLKAVIPLILNSVEEVLAAYGLESESELKMLRDIRENTMRASTSISNSGGIMNFIGSNIGGRGNTAKA